MLPQPNLTSGAVSAPAVPAAGLLHYGTPPTHRSPPQIVGAQQPPVTAAVLFRPPHLDTVRGLGRHCGRISLVLQKLARRRTRCHDHDPAPIPWPAGREPCKTCMAPTRLVRFVPALVLPPDAGFISLCGHASSYGAMQPTSSNTHEVLLGAVVVPLRGPCATAEVCPPWQPSDRCCRVHRSIELLLHFEKNNPCRSGVGRVGVLQ